MRNLKRPLILESSKSMESNCFLARASKREAPLLVIIGTSIPRSSANLPTRKEDLPVAIVNATDESLRALMASLLPSGMSLPGLKSVKSMSAASSALYFLSIGHFFSRSDYKRFFKNKGQIYLIFHSICDFSVVES